MKTFIFIFIFLLSGLAFGKTCDPQKMVTQACEYFNKNKSEKMIKLKDGSQYINPIRFRDVFNDPPKKVEPTEAEKKRMVVIFEKAKLAMIESIRNGVPLSKLTASKKNLIERIRLVEIVHPEEMQRDQILRCNAEVVGAFFNPNNSRVEICPMFYKYPEESLLFSLGHEISHSVDPCLAKSHIYEIPTTSLEDLYEEDKGDDELKDPSFTGWAALIGSSEQSVLHISDVGPNRSRLEGISKKISLGEPKISALKEGQYPYAEDIKCQAKKFKLKIASNDNQDCSSNQENEVMSDYFGAATVSQALPDSLTESQRYALIGGIFPDVCSKIEDGITHGAAYIPSRQRISEILLKMPDILSKLGCENVKSKVCLSLRQVSAEIKNKTESTGNQK